MKFSKFLNSSNYFKAVAAGNAMFKVILLTSMVCLTISDVLGAKILGVFPFPSLSHQVVYQSIWKELSLRGHQVTVLTPNPLDDPTLVNLTEIDLGFSYSPNLHKTSFQGMTNVPLMLVVSYMYDMRNDLTIAQLSHPVVQALIKDETKQFDVMLVEFQHPTAYALSARFNCPMIGITSTNGMMYNFDAVGSPSHPVLNPEIVLPYTDNLAFFERLYSTVFMLWFRYYYYYRVIPTQDRVARKYIKEDLPYLGDIERNVSMLFVNSNPIYHPIRPLTPAVIEMGNMHIKAKKPLPNDLQKQLDAATQGVVYFSLGSNVRSANLSVELRETITQALGELPYKVLWKWETDQLPGQPKNVFINKWYPQQDVLGHPNIKAFVTQGGLQSMEEAISNGVPLIGMPFFGDQPLNVMKMVHLGIAKAVDPQTVTKEQLKSAIMEVAGNPKYRNRIREISDLTSDVPMTGLEKAVWWTEYVIRHKGARHLRSPAIDMPWYQYLLLDVLAFVLGVILVAIYIIYKIISLIFKTIRKFVTQPKVKTS